MIPRDRPLSSVEATPVLCLLGSVTDTLILLWPLGLPLLLFSPLLTSGSMITKSIPQPKSMETGALNQSRDLPNMLPNRLCSRMLVCLMQLTVFLMNKTWILEVMILLLTMLISGLVKFSTAPALSSVTSWLLLKANPIRKFLKLSLLLVLLKVMHLLIT